MAHNHNVVGSTPTPATNHDGKWCNGSTDALGAPGGGSIPSFPTII